MSPEGRALCANFCGEAYQSFALLYVTRPPFVRKPYRSMSYDTLLPASDDAPPRWAARYARWIFEHTTSILCTALTIGTLAGLAAEKLPVHADFSYLLPPSSESVRHLRSLEKRAQVLGTAMVAVQSDDAGARQDVAHKLKERLSQLPREQVSNITFDQATARRFGWDNRWLFASLQDLKAAQAALKDGLGPLIRAANPMVDDLDAVEEGAPNGAQLAQLQARLAEAEQQKNDPGELVSHDGKLQMMVLQTPFPAGDVAKDDALLNALQPIIAATRAEHPNVRIGVAGDVLTSSEEHRAILQGMLTATVVTVGLVMVGMWLYFGSLYSVVGLAFSLGVGVCVTFAITRLTIGYLNVATAFLASIVVGNGVNFGIMLLSRYAEALRTTNGLGQQDKDMQALAVAIASTWRGTLAAALTASVAYLSLMVTDFRGFRDFGWIGGVGMVTCWVSAYTVLPAMLAVCQTRGLIRPRAEPRVGAWLARLLPKQVAAVAIAGLSMTAAAGVVAAKFLANDPYEANFKNLRSESAVLEEERYWMGAIDAGFGKGISGGFVIGLNARKDVLPLVKRLRALDAGKTETDKLFSRINALDDALPEDQGEKLAILEDIRLKLSDEALAELPYAVRKKALKLRPPQHLRALVDSDVPDAIAWPFIELDGSRGKLILAMSGWGYEIWNAHDLIRFSDQVRHLSLGDGVLLGGSAFVFSDMLRLVEQDGPRATLTSMLGAIVVILCVVGHRRYGIVTIVCGLSGTLTMLAIGACMGLRVNFLDFVALPITIGIGIDYAVNICARARQDRTHDPRRALSTAGGAVFLCSYTTIVGYGSLLLSTNKGIRSFGSAAILGEFTCLVTALWLAPALLQIWHHRRPTVE